ncbi:MAG TPA: hypothetical protein VJ044_05965 [Candidatus Hodarchaeales archaeon]|nr:hypothetical protein [Candidatus Hodarchaeales archaeon]
MREIHEGVGLATPNDPKVLAIVRTRIKLSSIVLTRVRVSEVDSVHENRLESGTNGRGFDLDRDPLAQRYREGSTVGGAFGS